MTKKRSISGSRRTTDGPRRDRGTFMMTGFGKKEVAGIYFSAHGLTIVQQSAGKIKSVWTQPYPASDRPAESLASDDVFEIFKSQDVELMAFLQKAVRDSKLETTNVVVSLPPKDLIIRFFEMPNLPRSEVLAGINFEMKKYIPFKVEELSYDFQYRPVPKASIIEVILCGIRQAPLDRYVELFKQLNLKVVAFEPGLFSLFRLLVFRGKISNQKSYIVLEFNREEANILIVDKGFSYFTRDIKLVAPGAGSKPAEELEAVQFRLINEVRVSLDYYRRQFLKKDVDEMLVVSDKAYESCVEPFSKELGLKVGFISLDDLCKAKDAREEMIGDACKALGAALRADRPSLVTLNLIKSREKAPPILGGLISETQVEAVLELYRESKTALTRGAIVGGVIVAVAYGMGFSKVFPLEKELAAAAVAQPPPLPGVDFSSLESSRTSEISLLEKERILREFIEKDLPVHKKLIEMARIKPQGVWLSNFFYNREPKTMDLSCFSFSESEKERSDNIKRFFEKLKAGEAFSKDFSLIDLRSFREMMKDNFSVMQFDIHCEKKV